MIAQRVAHAAGTLAPDRHARITAAVPTWTRTGKAGDRREPASSTDADFAKKAQLVARFVVLNGRIPRTTETHEGAPVGRWAATQRTNRSKLPQSRIDHLERIPMWAW